MASLGNNIATSLEKGQDRGIVSAEAAEILGPTPAGSTHDRCVCTSQPEPYVDAREGAAFLRLHPKTLMRLAREGVVRAYSFSDGVRHHWRFLAIGIGHLDEIQGKSKRTSSTSVSCKWKEDLMQRTRTQRGGVNLDVSSCGKQVWVFRWRETRPDGRRAPRKRVIGTLEEYPTKKAAENAARGFRLNLVDRGSEQLAKITMRELVTHFSEHEQVDKGDEDRAYSTRDRCESVLNRWILPRWGRTAIDQIRTVAVEEWLRSIPLANGTKSKIRNTMSALYNHAIRWEFTDKNPITGPVRGSGVRQSAKRECIPDLLEIEEFQRLQAELQIRERILVWLDMTLGLRRGELAGLRWEDIRFEDLTVMARRSIVDQVVGNVKTEASKRPIPIDPFIAEDLLLWYRTTKYNRPEDYVFATDAPRAGKKRGKQPVWLSKVMQYHIQPAAKRLGIVKRIGWHTFRRTYTTLLHANGEDVKVVQELLRHGSARITMDVYAQAMTPAKRQAQGKVAMLREKDRKTG